MSDTHVEPAPAELPSVNPLTEYNLTIAGKLIEAFTNDFNVTEACQYAGISRQTYYNWLEAHTEFAEGVDEAKTAPNRKAKTLIINALNAGDTGIARWYLERRDPEYKNKAELENNVGIQETRKKIGDFLDDDDSSDDERKQPPATDSEATGNEVAQPPTDIS